MRKRNFITFVFSTCGALILSSCLPLKTYLEGDKTYLHDNPKTELSKVTSAIFSQGGNAFPSQGNPNLLVVPVSFKGGSGFSNNDLENIQQTFFGVDNRSGWESVASYYRKSSYGKLDMGGMLSDVVYLNKTTRAYADEIKSSSDENSALSSAMADICSQVYYSLIDTFGKQELYKNFDSDSDGLLDGIWMVYDVDDDSSYSSLFWAFTGWNYSSIDGGSTGTRNPISAYCWASKSFMSKDNRLGNQDAHTFIHETGHLMGLEDYYDTEYNKGSSPFVGDISPFGGLAMMDNNILDHDAYSKWALGWIDPTIYTSSTLKEETTIELQAFEDSGDALVIGLPNNNGWFGEEYLILEYYTPTGLNYLDSSRKYASNSTDGYPIGYRKNGVIAYHVDSRYGVFTIDSKGNSSFNNYVYTESSLDLSNNLSDDQYFMLATNNDLDPNSASGRNTPFLISIYDSSNLYSNLKRSSPTHYADDTYLYHDGDSLRPDYVNVQQVHQKGEKFGINLSFGEQDDQKAIITLSIG